MKKLSIFLAFVLIFSLALTACSNGEGSAAPSNDPSSAPSQAASEPSNEPAQGGDTLEDTEIQVFIAASLSNAFETIVPLYNETHPNIKITCNADSSGKLLSQIQEGFECDIFFSAATAQIKTAQEEGLAIEGSRVDLLQNEVVLITWKGSGTAVTGIENIGEAKSIALADGSVPAGKYTRAALQKLGILDASLTAADITTQQVSEALGGVEINECGNVSKVCEAVKEGANEVGTVYYSDAYSVRNDVDILEHLSTDLTGDIIYPMIRTVNNEADDAQTAAADDFYAFLQTPEVMAIFEENMFVSNLG